MPIALSLQNRIHAVHAALGKHAIFAISYAFSVAPEASAAVEPNQTPLWRGQKPFRRLLDSQLCADALLPIGLLAMIDSAYKIRARPYAGFRED